MDLKKICEDVIELSTEVGFFIDEERDKFSHDDILIKGKHNFVTYVDQMAEEKLVKGLKKILHHSGFIAEEGTASHSGEDLVWVIDPLDGTTNYIHGAPPYAISIALLEKLQPVLGVVYEIGRSECFYSYTGGKAFLNGEPIRVSSETAVTEALIATGFPYHDYNRLESFMKTLEYFFQNSHGVRRLGSAATDLAYVACGRYDAFYEYNLNPWDVAAGAFLVMQSGGKVGDFKGGNDYIFGKEIVAANNKIFDSFQTIVGEIMNIQS